MDREVWVGFPPCPTNISKDKDFKGSRMSKNRNKDTGKFKKGNKASRGRGAPAGLPRRPRSQLRSTLRELQSNEEQALKVIKDSILGKEVDRESLNTSKWLITTIVTVNRAATADEQFSFNLRVHRDELRREEEREAKEKKEGTTGNVIPFSTRMVEYEDEDDEE